MRRSLACACLVTGCAQAAAPAGGDDAATIVARAPADAPAPPDAPAIDARPPPDAMPPIDATIVARMFTDDVAADFAGGATTDTTIEPWGAIEPVAYYTGGLVEHASDTAYFTDGPSTTWDQVMTYRSTGKAAISWWTSVNWVAGTPPAVGLTSGDTWSEWYQGEMWLEAGDWQISLLVDDHGFVDVATTGTTAWQRVVGANWSTESTGTFTAATTGWYPIRYAIAEETGNAEYHLQIAGPGVTKQPVPRDRLRARVDDLGGLVETAFDDSHGVGDYNTTIDATAPANVDWGTGNPGDLGITSGDTFSVRWTGQLRIDVAGAYTFSYATDDGQRLWIDGTLYLNTWGDSATSASTPAINLSAGWHDLVIEQTENAGGAAASLSIASGPELVGALPVARLRPVEARSDRIAPGSNHTDVAIPDLSTVSTTATVDAPAAATVTTVDVNHEFTHTFWGDLVITLFSPDGRSVILRNRADGATSGDKIERFTTAALAGAQVNGGWRLEVQDAAGSDTGTLLDFAVTPHYAGGQPPIAPAATYDSTVRDLGAGVVAIDAIDWSARAPGGTTIAVRVRTCAQPSDCATATWSPPVTASGGTPQVAAARYLQYEVSMTGDGDHGPILDSLTINYRVAL